MNREKRIGISIYPDVTKNVEGTKEYIKKAYTHGFSRIFTNFLEVKNDNEGQKKIEMFKEIWTYARELGYEVIVDVNPLIYQEFKLPHTEINFFKAMGATGIRLDEDFGGVIESKLSNNNEGFKIELNASATTKTIDEALRKNGNPKNLIACHNFYPMKYTGLQYERFIELSSHFKAKGVAVAAFITLPEEQKGVGPWNINQGMPTIEEHRELPLKSQLWSLLYLGVIDDIIVSQEGLTETQMKDISEIMNQFTKNINSESVELKLKLNDNVSDIEKEILNFDREFEFEGKLTTSHSNRPDYTSFFVRSTLTRLTFKDEKIPAKHAGKKLSAGDVVVLNESMGRYKGEVHIIKKPLEDLENGRNLIGKVDPNELYKVNLIKGGTKFKFSFS